MRTDETFEVRKARLSQQLRYNRTYLECHNDNDRTDRLKHQAERQQAVRNSEGAVERTAHLKRQLNYEITRNGTESTVKCISHLSYQRNKQAKLRGNINDKFRNYARSAAASEILDDIIEEHSLGSMTYPRSHCSVKFWRHKLSTGTKDCLKSTLPEVLRSLLTTADKQGRDLIDYIGAYNSALAFASLGVNLDKEQANARRRIYNFIIHSVVYHDIGQLTPREGKIRPLAKFTSMMVPLRELSETSWRGVSS